MTPAMAASMARIVPMAVNMTIVVMTEAVTHMPAAIAVAEVAE